MKQRKKEAFNQTYEEYIKTLHSKLNSKLWDSLGFPVDEEINTTDFFEIYNQVFGARG